MLNPRPCVPRLLSAVARCHKPYSTSIKSLEDLAKLKSLDDVDPDLVRKLINERTNELNSQAELAMLKQMQSQENQQQQQALKKSLHMVEAGVR
ncbi:Inner membrane assembly complex subunit 17 [Lachancea thermotolerans]